jgi:hypothetical protein
VLAPERLRDPAAIASILALEPELAVLADYGQIVPPALLELDLQSAECIAMLGDYIRDNPAVWNEDIGEA